MTKGLFRDGEDVYVSYDDRPGVPVSERRYILQNYKPLIEALPTREEYEADLRQADRPLNWGPR